jgi:hypothetical protein
MAGSRAADARESGQIREEAALSDTVRAPRTSLAGADVRRARPRTCFDAGCTVRSTTRRRTRGRVPQSSRLGSPRPRRHLKGPTGRAALVGFLIVCTRLKEQRKDFREATTRP